MKPGQSETFKILCIVICLFSFSCAGAVWSQPADPMKTGLPAITEDELQWQDDHMKRVKKVRLNRFGMKRVNRWRLKHKKARLRTNHFVPELGKDLEVVTGSAVIGAVSLAEGASELPAAEMPGSVDNSQLKYFPPIRSQGSLNSCGAFSGVYYTMTYMHALANDLDAKNGGDAFRLSPKWPYNMLNGGKNSGIWYYWAYEIGQRHGNATWEEFPYDSDYRAWSRKAETWENALYRRFDQSGYVANTHTDSGIAQVKQMLLNGYILNIPTYINSWKWMEIGDDPATADDDGFAGSSGVAWVAGTSGYHAMTVVGYNDEIWMDINGNHIVDSGEKGAFRIANSWGSGWHEGGFAWMAYDALKNPSAVEGALSTTRIYGWYPSRAHWVTARTGYAPKVIGRFSLNHLKRNHLRITLGSSDVSMSEATTLWRPEMVYNQGGAYGFDGTSNAVTGNFVFDLTDLLPSGGGLQTYYLNVQDDTSGDAATLSEFTVIDLAHGGISAVSPDAHQVWDADTLTVAVDYNYHDGNMAPEAYASASDLSATAPATVFFDGSDSYDPEGQIASYHWDFGDGAFQNGVEAEHVFETAGLYTVVLTVTDHLGESDTGTVSIEILSDPSANQSPESVISAGALSGAAPVEITFNGTGSGDADGMITGYEWDFGDGTDDTGEKVTHIFYDPGVYLVTLVVVDDAGARHSSQVQVSVLSDEEVPLYISNFGTDVCEGPGCNGDIDGDGDVDGMDLLFLALEIHQDKE